MIILYTQPDETTCLRDTFEYFEDNLLYMLCTGQHLRMSLIPIRKLSTTLIAKTDLLDMKE